MDESDNADLPFLDALDICRNCDLLLNPDGSPNMDRFVRPDNGSSRMQDGDKGNALMQRVKDVGFQTVEVLDFLCKERIKAGNIFDHLDDGLPQSLLSRSELTARHKDKRLSHRSLYTEAGAVWL